MQLRPDGGRKLLGLLMAQNEQGFLLMVGILFIPFPHLFLQPLRILVELEMEVLVRILNCLFVGRPCLGLLVLVELVNYRIHQ